MTEVFFMTALSLRRSFSGTTLKTIACITMLVDHIGASCIEAGILTPGLDVGTLSQDTLSAYPLYRLDMVLRFTGRLAFPLFCFLLVEGFVHTHNVKGYLGRLVLFGLLSEVPFDLAFFRTPFDPSAQNVYWTLALGVLAMAGLPAGVMGVYISINTLCDMGATCVNVIGDLAGCVVLKEKIDLE